MKGDPARVRGLHGAWVVSMVGVRLVGTIEDGSSAFGEFAVEAAARGKEFSLMTGMYGRWESLR